MAEVKEVIIYITNNNAIFYTTDTELDKISRYFNNPDLLFIGLNVKQTPNDETAVSRYINKNDIRTFARVDNPDAIIVPGIDI